MKTIIALTILALVGCAGYDVQGVVYVVDPVSGAKAGISRGEGTTTVYGKQYGSDGNLIGGATVVLVDRASGK